MSLNIRLDDADVQRWLRKNLNKFAPTFENIIRDTTIYGLTYTKKRLSRTKRSGSLAKSYNQKRTGKFRRLIFSPLKYAHSHEYGRKGRGRTIKAGSRNPRAKFIPIALDESLLNKTGGLKGGNSKQAKARFKKAVEDGRLIFVKKAKMSDIKGKFVLNKKVSPVIHRKLRQNVNKHMKALGYN